MTNEPTPKWLSIAFLLIFLFDVALFLPLGVWGALGATVLTFGFAGVLVIGFRALRERWS